LLVWTDAAIQMLAHVAVMTEDLESIWEIIFDEPLEKS